MSEDPPEYFDDPEWEDAPDPVWKEFDWQRYLHESAGEIERFLTLYSAHQAAPDRLDRVARILGWDSGDWSVEDFPQPGESGEGEVPAAERRLPAEYDPFTVHQHPVFVATRGLYLFIRRHWETLLMSRHAPAEPQLSWMLARALHEGEMAGVLATQAVELGDVELAVCHFKQMLGEINRALTQLPEQEASLPRKIRVTDRLLRAALFDLREIALRVIHECRDEARRRPSDRD